MLKALLWAVPMRPEIGCAICKQPVVLEKDRYADEDGRVVHVQCYVDRLLVAARNKPPAQHNE